MFTPFSITHSLGVKLVVIFLMVIDGLCVELSFLYFVSLKLTTKEDASSPAIYNKSGYFISNPYSIFVYACQSTCDRSDVAAIKSFKFISLSLFILDQFSSSLHGAFS